MLVNSSFELVPGLPIHTTRDLVTWTHTANAVDEAMSHRLLIDGVEDSGGLYAPTNSPYRRAICDRMHRGRVNE